MIELKKSTLLMLLAVLILISLSYTMFMTRVHAFGIQRAIEATALTLTPPEVQLETTIVLPELILTLESDETTGLDDALELMLDRIRTVETRVSRVTETHGNVADLLHWHRRYCDVCPD